MLHHVPTDALQDRVIGEIARVLGPGAALVASDSLASDDLANAVSAQQLEQRLLVSFDDRGNATLVTVRVTDFGGDGPAAREIDSMSGLTLVLASLKMWLEHRIEGDLMYDKFPDAAYSDR